MIYLMEVASARAVAPFLPPGWVSVGTEVNVRHLGAAGRFDRDRDSHGHRGVRPRRLICRPRARRRRADRGRNARGGGGGGGAVHGAGGGEERDRLKPVATLGTCPLWGHPLAC